MESRADESSDLTDRREASDAIRRETIAISLARTHTPPPPSPPLPSWKVIGVSPKSPSMQADGWISAPAPPLFSLLGFTPEAGGKEQGS